MQGILCTDISYHYAIFHIAGNISFDTFQDSTKFGLIREVRRKNDEKCMHQMKTIDWNSVISISDAQAAYNEFNITISDKYATSIQYRKLIKP